MGLIYARSPRKAGSLPEAISSTANPMIKSVRELHRRKGRKARNQTLIEGPVAFAEFLSAAFAPDIVLCTPNDLDTIEVCRRVGLVYTLVTEEVLAAAADTRTPQSPIAVIDILPAGPIRLHNTLVLIDVADPGNVGTMIRTATALDWDVGAAGTTADVWAPKTLRAGAGAHAHAHLVDASSLVDSPADSDLTTVAMVVAGGVAPHVHERPVALLVGSEAHGLPCDLIERCHVRTTIPMPGGAESLNAAVAAAIAMYAMTDVVNA